RIYKRYREGTVALVRKAPYKLAEEVHGVGFLKADQVARGLAIAPDDPGRVRAGVYHVLRVARDDGHCFVPRDTLVANATDLLGVDPDLVPPAIASLVADGKVVLSAAPEGYNPASDDAVYLAALHEAEVGAA